MIEGVNKYDYNKNYGKSYNFLTTVEHNLSDNSYLRAVLRNNARKVISKNDYSQLTFQNQLCRLYLKG